MKEFGKDYRIHYRPDGVYTITSDRYGYIITLTSEDIDAIYQYKKDVEDGPNE